MLKRYINFWGYALGHGIQPLLTNLSRSCSTSDIILTSMMEQACMVDGKAWFTRKHKHKDKTKGKTKDKTKE